MCVIWSVTKTTIQKESGFTPVISCIFHIATAHGKYVARGSSLDFVDIEKAYDMVSRIKLEEAINALNIDGYLLSMMLGNSDQ